MNEERTIHIRYRLERAHEALEEAAILWQTGHYNAYVNRLYYACFYAINALLLQGGYASSTHSGTRHLFSQHFVKTGQVSKEHADIYYALFHYRQESDYKDNYRIDQQLAEPWLRNTRQFVSIIEGLVRGE